MNWNNCQYFTNQNQCKNKRHKNGVCKNHLYKRFRGEYIVTCLSGEGYIYPIKSKNEMDIVSYEQIWTRDKKRRKLKLEIPRELIFTLMDNKNLYIFNILSLISDIKSILNQKIIDIKVKNPITNKELSIYDKVRLKLKLEYLHDFNHPDIKIEIIDTPFNKLLSILVKFENSGFFFDPNWFKNLTSMDILKIINETKLIWNYYNQNLEFNVSDNNFTIKHLIKFYELIYNNKELDTLNKSLMIIGGLTYVIPAVRSLYPDLLHE